MTIKDKNHGKNEERTAKYLETFSREKTIKLLIKKKLKNKLVINIAKAPFPPSRISVSRAIFLLPVLRTLVAPILPLPTFLISPNPDNLVKIKPKGIDPNKYPEIQNDTKVKK